MFAFHKNYHHIRIQHGRKPLVVKHLLKINLFSQIPYQGQNISVEVKPGPQLKNGGIGKILECLAIGHSIFRQRNCRVCYYIQDIYKYPFFHWIVLILEISVQYISMCSWRNFSCCTHPFYMPGKAGQKNLTQEQVEAIVRGRHVGMKQSEQ